MSSGYILGGPRDDDPNAYPEEGLCEVQQGSKKKIFIFIFGQVQQDGTYNGMQMPTQNNKLVRTLQPRFCRNPR